MAGLEDCESLFAHLKKNKLITEKFRARHFLARQQAIEIQELGNFYWIPGRENPADGLTKLHSAILPLLRLMESGSYNPGYLGPRINTLIHHYPSHACYIICVAQPIPPAPKCLETLCMLLLVGTGDGKKNY